MSGIDVTPAQCEAFDHEWFYHVLPDGRGVHASFFEPEHRYMVKDPFNSNCFDVPSVTGIIERAGWGIDYNTPPPGVPFRRWKEMIERKRKIGSYVHKAAHYLAQDDLDTKTIGPTISPYFNGYLKFLKDSGFIVQFTERRLIGCWNGLWWCGTADVIGLWHGQPAIADLKCVDTLYPGHELQTAGYKLTLPKPLVPPFRYLRFSLHLPGNDDYVRPKVHDDPRDEDRFLEALKLDWEKRRRKR